MIELREALAGGGYTVDGLRSVLGSPPGIGMEHDRDVYLRRLGHGRTEILARLFWIGDRVPVEEARSALRPVDPQVLADAGLLEIRDGQAHAPWKIALYEDLYLACDHDGRRLEPDYVTGVNPSGTMLADLTIRRPARSALDLGTGSGIQALMASRHSERVIGVDLSERALKCAKLNAAINGAAGLETRMGSWFEPVEGEEFDLIVANPPFVVSPETDLTYRDSDLPGDEVSMSLIREAAARLAEGGYAYVVCNWIHRREGDWREPLEAQFEGSGCDAVLLSYETYDTVGYAALWNRPLAQNFGEFRAAVDRWLDYYAQAGIEAISWGAVILRRRSTDGNWIRAFEVPGSPRRGSGAHVERLFTGKDYLRSLRSDDEILDGVFSLPGETSFEHVFGPGCEEHTLVRNARSVGFAARIEPRAAQALARCDGKARLRDLAADGSVVGGAKRLLELGFLAPPAR